MKKRINDILLQMQSGEKCIGDAANELNDLISARSFVESVGDLAEYVDGADIDIRFKNHTVPVIEYNELREAADKWDNR